MPCAIGPRTSVRSHLSRRLALVALVTCSTVLTYTQVSVDILPARKIYPVYRADALAHQLSISRVTDNREWIGVIGGSVPLLELSEPGCTASLGIGASVFNRIIKTPGHITLSTVDYRFDLPVDFKLPAVALRVGYGHISNHYADDGNEVLHLQSISSVKDYVQAGLARDIAVIGGMVYINAAYNYHNEPLRDRRWILQAGGDFGNYPLSTWAQLYGAIDLKIKEEVNWGSTQSYQVGFILASRDNRGFRVAYTLRTGFEERGQLYDLSVTNHLISLFIDL